MQFKITPNPTFNVQVSLSVPEQMGTAEVAFEFKYQNKTQLDAWLKNNKSKLTSQALCEIVVSWGVKSHDDLELPVTADNMAELLNNYPAAGVEIIGAYYKALTESRAKN